MLLPPVTTDRDSDQGRCDHRCHRRQQQRAEQAGAVTGCHECLAVAGATATRHHQPRAHRTGWHVPAGDSCVVVLCVHLATKLGLVSAQLCGDGFALCRPQVLLSTERLHVASPLHQPGQGSPTASSCVGIGTIEPTPVCLMRCRRTCESVPELALLLIHGALLALQALSVQVLLSQPSIATQHACWRPLRGS